MFSENSEGINIERGGGMKKFLSDVFSKKNRIIIAAGIALGVALILYSPGLSGGEEEDASEKDEYYKVSYYTQNLEDRIKKLCLSIEGVSKADVLLTLESGSEYVYASNTEEEVNPGSSSSYSSDYLILNSGDKAEPVVVTEIYPKIRGVAVVCTGGDAADMKEKITTMLSAALGISSNRIKVTS